MKKSEHNETYYSKQILEYTWIYTSFRFYHWRRLVQHCFLFIFAKMYPHGSATMAGRLWVLICGLSAALIGISLLNYDSKEDYAKAILSKTKKFFKEFFAE